MLYQFHKVMGHPIAERYVQNSETDRLRMKLLSEEFDEVCSAESEENLLKELADMLYVIHGYATSFGWDLDEAFRRVHASNMSKLGDDGKPVFADGKVMKSDNYKEPSVGLSLGAQMKCYACETELIVGGDHEPEDTTDFDGD